MAACLSSGEGLIAEICDKKNSNKDEEKEEGTEEGMSHGLYYGTEGDKRLLVDEREFFQALAVMKREGNTLSRVIRNAWDAPEYITSMVRNNKQGVTRPMISIVGHITADELVRMLDLVSMANGYANRFNFCLCPPF